MIRDATHRDIATLMTLGESMHGESPRFKQFKWEPLKVYDLYESLIGSPHGILLVAETVDQHIIGFMAGAVVEHFFSKAKFASDFALYVDPGYRGSPAAVRMIREFEKRARARGAVECTPGVSTQVDQSGRIVSLYRRLGYESIGNVMLKEL